jgi:hypothetical protein
MPFRRGRQTEFFFFSPSVLCLTFHIIHCSIKVNASPTDEKYCSNFEGGGGGCTMSYNVARVIHACYSDVIMTSLNTRPVLVNAVQENSVTFNCCILNVRLE